jgi:hypothetical protein
LLFLFSSCYSDSTPETLIKRGFKKTFNVVKKLVLIYMYKLTMSYWYRKVFYPIVLFFIMNNLAKMLLAILHLTGAFVKAFARISAWAISQYVKHENSYLRYCLVVKTIPLVVLERPARKAKIWYTVSVQGYVNNFHANYMAPNVFRQTRV